MEIPRYGDDARPWNAPAGVAVCGKTNVYACTRPEGHEGFHVACGTTYVMKVWGVTREALGITTLEGVLEFLDG